MTIYRLRSCTTTALLRRTSAWIQRPCSAGAAALRPFSATATDAEYSDVIIVGGGVVGCALARLLNQRLPSLSVHLLEARDAPNKSRNVNSDTVLPHPRSYALSPQSLEVLGILGSKEASSLAQNVPLGAYDTMQVWEANNPATVRFHTDDLAFDESKLDQPKMLGAVVEDGALVSALWEPLEEHPQTTLSTNTTLKEFKLPAEKEGLVTLETSNGTKLRTRLLVAADGAMSPIRKQLGISQMQWDYGRSALTFTVELAQDDPLPRTAYQRFVHDDEGSGPLALLPTYSPRHAIIVWSTTPEVVQKWKETDENDALIQHLQDLLQTGPQRLPPLVEPSETTRLPPFVSNILYGVERVLDTVQDGGALAAATATPSRAWMAPPALHKVVSPKLSFPLACRNVPHYHAAHRVVLVGDAAHTVHPMAGQGLNLGLGAVQSLIEALEETESVGMDVTASLEKFLQKRHAANSTAILGIHALHELFHMQKDNPPMMHAKSFGMNVLQQVGPLRRRVVQAATQGVLL